jgi:hypothetical protein
MSTNVSKVNYREITNQKQGRSGAGTPKKPGPAKGRKGVVNPTKSGGIFRAPKSN